MNKPIGQMVSRVQDLGLAAGKQPRKPSLRAGDIVMKTLALVAPISSVVITRFQGTTPAFVLLLVLLIVPFFGFKKYSRVLISVSLIILIQILLMTLAMSSYLISPPNLISAVVIRDVFIIDQLRLSNITQAFYLTAALSFMIIVIIYYKPYLLKWSFYGIILLVFYGYYEFIYFAIFQRSGDILSNRIFGDIELSGKIIGYNSGSLVQTSLFFGRGFMRFKSLTGEPSMYALTAVPFAIYAYHMQWHKTFLLIAITLFLSQSTTAVIGMSVGLFYLTYRNSAFISIGLPILLLVFILLYFTSDELQRAANVILFDKLNSYSGIDRLQKFSRHFFVIFDGNIIRLLFGLGFGTVRSTDMLSNILANTGIVGFAIYSTIILLPLILMKEGPDRKGIAASILGIYAMEMLTVSEYSYLPPWFFIALGYVRWRSQRSTKLLEYQDRSPFKQPKARRAFT